MIEFFIAALVIAIAPGPDNLFVLSQSGVYGIKSGFCIILGLCTGILIQTLFLVLGVSAIFIASPYAFFALQCLGACYLLYLAFKSFQVREQKVFTEQELSKMDDVNVLMSKQPSNIRLYFRGIIMNLTNPKAVLFLFSFIPPSVNLERNLHPAIQTFILGLEFILSVIIVFGLIAILAGSLKKFLLNSPKANRNLNWFSGFVFIFMAFALFLL